jgi:hypothetical protein
MKTPRQIILDRHRASEAKLNALRQAALKAAFQVASSPEDLHTPEAHQKGIPFPVLLWREFVLSSWRIWTGFAWVWLVILVLNLAVRDESVMALERSPLNAPQPSMLLRARQQLMMEFAHGLETAPVIRPENASPDLRQQGAASARRG